VDVEAIEKEEIAYEIDHNLFLVFWSPSWLLLQPEKLPNILYPSCAGFENATCSIQSSLLTDWLLRRYLFLR